VEIRLGHENEFRERARLVDYTKDGAIGAVALQLAAAPGTGMTSEVNFPGDTLAVPRRRIALYYFAYKLMPGDSRKTVVTPLQFEIGAADSRA
jgi:hypothetical protein